MGIHIGIVHRISVCRPTVNHERKLTSQSVELFVKMASDLAKKQAKTGPKNATPSNEEIVQGFQRLRAEQRQLANKLSELEMDLNEHKLVIETLTGVDGDRKCFRMVGEVLVERTVKEVLPALILHRDQMVKLIEVLNKQVTSKGQEINEYKEKNNIRIRNRDEVLTSAQESSGEKKVASQGVLVGSKA